MKYACYFGSRQIYADMALSAKTLLMHSDVDKIFFLIEDDTFPFEIPDCIEVINISEVVPKIFSPNGPNYHSNWTYIGLIRGALTKVFPDLDVILSIDCDTIVDKDISDLWDYDITDYYFAAAKEPILSDRIHGLYTNVGMTLFNLKKLREDHKDDEIIEFMDTKYLYFVSQDALNGLCQGHILEIPSDYNSCDYTLPTSNRKVIHYAGNKHWRDYEIVKKYREMPWVLTV